MSISRNFIIISSIYLIVGVCLGTFMAASGNHSLSPAHAHINLLGFVLMAIFGVIYRIIPKMSENWLGKAHFWLHTICAFIIVVMLTMMLAGVISEAAMVPLAPIAEIGVIVSSILFFINLWKHA